MIFLQPELLWGLAAAPLPILIHLLNRLRYRRIAWAAMRFLTAATRSSTRRSRLRHYLVLACRLAALTSILLLLTRPLLGGWLGATFAGAPDLVVIALDRSASMETEIPGAGRTRRDFALDLIGAAPRAAGWTATRFLFLDSATLRAQPVGDASGLSRLAAAAPTDTGTDMPALMRAAAEALARERPGRAELWVASDLQASSWAPQAERWRAAAASLAALPQDLTVRVLAVGTPAEGNRSARLREVRRMPGASRPRLELAVEFRQDASADVGPVPIAWNALGARSQTEHKLEGPAVTVARAFDWLDGVDVMWGGVELPPDANRSDNRIVFAVALPERVRVVAAAEDPVCARRLRLAAAPVAGGRVDFVETTPGDIAGALADPPALIVWQGLPPPAAALAAMLDRVRAGAVMLWLPPAAPPAAADTGAWGSVDVAEGEPWRLSAWEESEGPLARTLDGRSLPLDRLEVARRAAWAGGEGWTPLAWFADGRSLLSWKAEGLGRWYALSTLPLDAWSSLGDGWVWVPMLQRMIDEGSRRTGGAEMGVCGRWSPASPDEVWRAVDAAADAPGLRVGIYRSGRRWLALNRPDDEDDRETVDPAALRDLLAPVRVRVSADLSRGGGEGAVRSELWPLLAVLAIACLLAESALLGSEYAAAPSSARESPA